MAKKKLPEKPAEIPDPDIPEIKPGGVPEQPMPEAPEEYPGIIPEEEPVPNEPPEEIPLDPEKKE